jgi:phage baseplate assembly protein W
MEYLALPVELREDYLRRSENLAESISNSVGFLLSSRPGSLEFLPEFGCGIWDLEFCDLDTANKADIRASLRNAIAGFEKRLYNVSVSFINIGSTGARTLGMKVKVSGNYRDGEAEKKFEASYDLS